jgi:hypothetical protein
MPLIDLGELEPPAAPAARARLPKHVVWGIAGLVLGAALVYTTRPASEAAVVKVTPPPSAVTPMLPWNTSNLISGANQRLSANALGGDLVASELSRVLINPPSGEGAREVVFRSHGSMPAGDFTLVLICVGQGRISVVLRVGASVNTQIADCTDAADASQMMLTRVAGDVEVRLTAVDAEDVAVSGVVVRT